MWVLHREGTVYWFTEQKPISNLIVGINVFSKIDWESIFEGSLLLCQSVNVISFLAPYRTVTGNHTNLNMILVFAKNYFKETEGQKLANKKSWFYLWPYLT